MFSSRVLQLQHIAAQVIAAETLPDLWLQLPSAGQGELQMLVLRAANRARSFVGARFELQVIFPQAETLGNCSRRLFLC